MCGGGRETMSRSKSFCGSKEHVEWQNDDPHPLWESASLAGVWAPLPSYLLMVWPETRLLRPLGGSLKANMLNEKKTHQCVFSWDWGFWSEISPEAPTAFPLTLSTQLMELCTWTCVINCGIKKICMTQCFLAFSRDIYITQMACWVFFPLSTTKNE